MVDIHDPSVLDIDNYSISLNGEEESLKSISIEKKKIEVCSNTQGEEKELEGIHSLKIQFNTSLFNKKITVKIKKPPQDLFENSSPKSLVWPR